MVKPLEDLGVHIVKKIHYYNARRNPVKDNTEFHNELFKMGIEFAKIIKNEV